METPCILILPATAARWFQVLLQRASSAGRISLEVREKLFIQFFAQIPNDVQTFRSGTDFELKIEIAREDLLHLVALGHVFEEDDNRQPVGAEFLVQAKNALLPVPPEEQLSEAERKEILPNDRLQRMLESKGKEA